MFLFSNISKTQKDEKYNLIIDISSESIGASFVRIKEGQKPHIINTIRHQIPFQEKVSVKRLISLLKETLDIVLDDLIKKGNKIYPEKVIIALASPWCASQTRIVEISEENEFEITEELFEEIVEKEEKNYLSEIQSNSQGEKLQIEIIESNIIDIKVNGYNVEKPIGIKTKNLRLSIHVTSSQTLIINTIKDLILKRWIKVKYKFISFIYSSFNVIKDKLSKETSFLIVNVSGEVTDLSLIIDDVIISSISFPYGFHAFLRSVSKELSLVSEAAYSEIKLYNSSKLSKDRIDQISSILDKTASNWSSVLKTSIKQLTKYKIIPKNIYIISSNEYLNLLEYSINERSGEIMGENKDNFKVTKLDETLLLGFVSQENKECEDLFIYVTIIMLEKLIDIEQKYNKNFISNNNINK